MRRVSGIAAALAALLFGAAPVARADFAAETFTLDNGMQVVVLPDHRAPVVTHMVWYRVGSTDEPMGKSGIAHFLEHLMFKGTDEIPPGEFSKTVARNGGQDNAFTSHDYTAYFQRVARDRLELVMKMEADRMTDLALTDELVLPERDVILEERSTRTDNDPGRILFEQMNAALFLNHPYGRSVIGWRHEMEGLTRDDALAFYARFYAPNNAILIVAGDITLEELRPLAEKYYGTIDARDLPPRLRLAEPPALAPRRIVLEDARARQPNILRFYHAPSSTTAAGNDAYALEVLAQVLGASSGRLNRMLVEEQGLAASASAWYAGLGIDSRYFGFSLNPRPETSMEALEAGLDRLIADAIANGFTEEEVARAKTVLMADAIFAKDSQQQMANNYGVMLTTGWTIEEIEAWPSRISEVTSADLQRVAAAYLVPNGSVTGHLVPGGAQ